MQINVSFDLFYATKLYMVGLRYMLFGVTLYFIPCACGHNIIKNSGNGLSLTCGKSRVHGGLLPGVDLFPGKSIGPERDTVATAAVGLLERTATWTQAPNPTQI